MSPISPIHTTLTIDPILVALESATQDDLVVFDVDQVLLDPVDWILSGQGNDMKWEYFRDILDRLGQETFDYLYSIIVRDRMVRPMDEALPAAIARLQHRGVRVLALTAFWDGAYGVIQDMSQFRVKQLNDLGYDFSHHHPVQDDLFTHLHSPRLERHPRLRRGVITTSHVPKGEALIAYIQRHHLHPKRVIFVDDNPSYMANVHKACQQESIDFQGYLWLKATPHTAPNDPKVLAAHRRRATTQFSHLEHHHQWLDDEAVGGLDFETSTVS